MSELNNDDYKLILSDFFDNKLFGFYFYKNKLQRISELNEQSIVGNIYCGYVKDIVKNIKGAFIEFDDNEKGYYSLNDNKTIFLSDKKNNDLKQGDVILVQVSSDKIKTKDYSLTSKINLTGKYAVLTVGNTNISISRKINNLSVREQLTSLLDSYKNNEYGFILRTNCIDAPTKDIIREIDYLVGKWNEIRQKAVHLKAKSKVYSASNPVAKECAEFHNKYGGTILTDNDDVYQILLAGKIPATRYSDSFPLHKCYSLEKHLHDAIKKKVWLKSGAYLIIEPTEAMTVIDVNTGKAEFNSKSREETFKKINDEAAVEIARQLKIRNISGMILVDFISMNSHNNDSMLIKHMEELLKYDYTKCNVVSITKLGLMEITRKKKSRSIYDIFKDKDDGNLVIKNAKIKSLQNQINAHFMYNVLESIKMMAEIKEDFEISDAITSLGQMFRYSMKWSSSGMVSLREEIQYIKQYLDLVNLRFDYEIYLSLNIPPELLDIQIPKMCLQPIVENSVYHGIESMAEDTYIYIKATKDNDIVNIEISDAGKGMSEKELKRITRNLQNGTHDDTDEHGIALHNVQERLHLYFGKEYGLQLFSKEGIYTKVLIQLPLERNVVK